MCNYYKISNFLKLIRIFGLFPYQWNSVNQEAFLGNQKPKLHKCIESFASPNEFDNKIQFKKSKIWSFVSNLISLVIISFAVTVTFDVMVTEISLKIFGIAVPIIGGVFHCLSITIAFYISSESMKLSKIFVEILKIDFKNSPMKLSFRFKQFDFILYLISCVISNYIYFFDIIKNLKKYEYFYVIIYTYYSLNQTQIYLISITFKTICYFYLYVIKKYLSYLPMKKLNKSKKLPDVKIIENNLEISISKFLELNQNQKLINSYFGPLLSFILISHICWLILFPLTLISAYDMSSLDFSDIIKIGAMFLWPILDICFLSTAPYLLIKKVIDIINNCVPYSLSKWVCSFFEAS